MVNLQSTDFKFRVDQTTFEVLRHRLDALVREMGIAMERTSRSPIYHEAHDFTTSVLTGDGQMVAQVEYIPVQILAAPFACRAVTQFFGEEIQRGDVFLCNDPYTLGCGNHLADWTVLVPVFYNEKLVFWSVNRAHQIDTGGMIPGGYCPDALDIHGEGLRIPPVKIYERGALRKDVLEFVLANIRYRALQRADLMSMLGSAWLGEKRLIETLERFSLETVQNTVADLIDYAEILMREELGKMPDAVANGEAITDGTAYGGPYTVRCRITKKHRDMTIDFSETDSQVRGYINSSLSNTYTSTFIALLTTLGKRIPRCEGAFKPFKIITKPGTLTHALYPACMGHCTNFVAKQIIESVWVALSKLVPEKTPAGWGSIAFQVVSAADPRSNFKPYSTMHFLSCAAGSGAIWGADGWHTTAPQICSGGLTYPSVEMYEFIYPLLIKKFELVTDDAGPGRWRGGSGAEYVFVHLGTDGIIALAGDGFRHAVPVPAVAGGKPPSLNRMTILRKGEEIDISGKQGAAVPIHPGDIVVTVTGGGCGVGNPFERDPEQVRMDVLNEFVSLESVRKDYGVAIDEKTLQVDYPTTNRLRSEKSKTGPT